MGKDIPSKHPGWERKPSPDELDPRPSARIPRHDHAPDRVEHNGRARGSRPDHRYVRRDERLARPAERNRPSRDGSARNDGARNGRRPQEAPPGHRPIGRDLPAPEDRRRHDFAAARGRWGDDERGSPEAQDPYPSRKERERSREREHGTAKDSRALAREDFERHRRKKEEAELAAETEGGKQTSAPQAGRNLRQRLTQQSSSSLPLLATAVRPRQQWKEPVAGGGKWGHDKFEEVKDGPQKKDPMEMLSWW